MDSSEKKRQNEEIISTPVYGLAPGRVRGWNGLLAAAREMTYQADPQDELRHPELAYSAEWRCVCGHIILCTTFSWRGGSFAPAFRSGDVALRIRLLSQLYRSERRAAGRHWRGGEGKDRQMR